RRSSAIGATPTFVFPYSPPAAFVSAVKRVVFPEPGSPTMPTSSAMTAHDTHIRRVLPGEWRELRELRLEALRDAPDAFVTRCGFVRTGEVVEIEGFGTDIRMALSL